MWKQFDFIISATSDASVKVILLSSTCTTSNLYFSVRINYAIIELTMTWSSIGAYVISYILIYRKKNVFFFHLCLVTTYFSWDSKF